MIDLTNIEAAQDDLNLIMAEVNIPDYMRGAFERYLIYGTRPGGFAQSVLENNLSHATTRADNVNKRLLHVYGALLWSFPQEIYGSKGKVETWMAGGGLTGKLAKQARDAAQRG